MDREQFQRNRWLLWHVSVTTSIEAEEAVGVLFEQLFHRPAVAYVDEETKAVLISVFLDRLPGNANELRNRLRDGLRRIDACGLATGPGTIRMRHLRHEDWAESWKRHFKPVVIGRSLLIRPGWNRRKPVRGQALVVLDPGLSFGTGQHPTTKFCLQQLAAGRKTKLRRSLLDLGTGSGILAIAGAKLGYRPVCAIDSDPVAIRVAKANAEDNGVRGRIQIQRQELRRLPIRSDVKFDVICANLTADLLLLHARRVVSRLSTDGTLVLSGITVDQFEAIRKAYAVFGLDLRTSRVVGEWQSGAFEPRRSTGLQGVL